MCGIFLLLLLGCWFVLDIPGLAESRLVYFPSREPFLTPPGHADINIPAPGGGSLHAWLIMPDGWTPGDPPAPAVLHLHGNAGNISHHAEFSEFLPRAGFAVLLFDYRGYGRSHPVGGRFSRRGLLADAKAALEDLQRRPEIDPDRIAVYGVSLGGVLGLALAAERQEIRAAVSLAAFSSWSRIARDHFGWLGWLLARPGLDADESISRLGARSALIVHGGLDDIVPPSHAERLKASADAAGVAAELLLVPGAGHNDLAIGDPETQARIVEFLRRCLAPAPG